MEQLARHTGAWTGTNAFRLMPGDSPHEAAARTEVSLAAGGHLAELEYSWSHPDDGDQRGLLVIGPGDSPGTVTAFWGDSWHQSPQPRTLAGTVEGGVVQVSYVYSGEWRWTIVVDATDDDVLVLRMDNTIPESAAGASSAAGPYAAMQATMSR